MLVMKHREQAYFRETCGMQIKNTQCHGSMVYIHMHTSIYACKRSQMKFSVNEYHNILHW